MKIVPYDLFLQTNTILSAVSSLSAMQKRARTMGNQRDNLLGMGKGVTEGLKRLIFELSL